MGYAIRSFYALPAMTVQGMAIVVCPDAYTLYRNQTALQHSGYGAPTVMALDGTQMPHEERAIFSEINHNRVQLLFVTPEKFSSLNFIQVMVHAKVSFLAIENAHYLLEGFSGSYRYWKLWEGLENLRKRPPLVLFSHTLPPARLHELTRRLGLKTYESFQKEPALEQTKLRVKLLITENEKFRYLCAQLSGDPENEAIGPLLNPGSVIIRTNSRKTCQKVAAALAQFGFNSVLMYHPSLTPSEKETIEKAFATQPNVIVVMFGYGENLLTPPAGSELQFIFWEMPASLEELFINLFQVPSEDASGIARTVEGHVLYTKEDYQRIFNRLKYEWANDLGVKQAQKHQVKALKQVRQWVLSKGCRYDSLISFWQGETVGITTDLMMGCGYCDECLTTSNGGFLRKMLRHWLY